MSKLSRICTITHNVGNIRFSSHQKWLGQSGEYKGFVKFIDEIYGIRALIKLIENYIVLSDCYSVNLIISRYAPSTENNTEDYIKFVEDAVYDVGGNPHCVTIGSHTFFEIVKAICKYETNYDLTLTEFCYVVTRFKI